MKLKVILLFCGLAVSLSIFGPFFVPATGLGIDLRHDLAGPSLQAPLGYAENGINLLVALLYGARLSLGIATICTVIAVAVGVVLGTAAAFFGGLFDRVLSQVVDIALSFPGILLAIYLGAILKPSIMNLIMALSATGWVSYARVARAQVLMLKAKDFVLAAQVIGATRSRIIFRHLLPHTLGPIVVQAGFGFSGIIIAEASLSFLGIGVPVGTPSFGALLDQGVTYLFVAPHIAIYTVACISAAVLLCNFLSEALRDTFDRKSR